MAGESSGDLEAMKQEILREMRKEINKAKQEIIEGNVWAEGKRGARILRHSPPLDCDFTPLDLTKKTLISDAY